MKANKFFNIIKDLGPIIVRNLFSLITILIGVIVALLVIFGDIQEALFIGSVIALNVIIGIVQELRAKLALEKLQALTVQKVNVIKNGQKVLINIDKIKIGDHYELNLGDQVPVDSIVLTTNGMEVNEALLSGESNNIIKEPKTKLFGGSIVMSGSAIVLARKTVKDSYITHMTDKIKHYNLSFSPIQKSLSHFIEIMSIILLLFASLIVIRGVILNLDAPFVIKQIASFAGSIVPEGLVLATTLLFVYGAVKMLKGKVLLQEINAIENLGHIVNLCVDKTGTLTGNKPVLDNIENLNTNLGFLKTALIAYIKASGLTTETIKAIDESLDHTFYGKIINVKPFSLDKKYGLVCFEFKRKTHQIIVGGADIVFAKAGQSLKDKIKDYSLEAKRVIGVGEIDNLSTDLNSFSLANSKIKPLGLISLINPLKPGTNKIVEYFRKRNVLLRIISGDNLQTVLAIAKKAGISNLNKVIEGSQLKAWRKEDYLKNAPNFSLFARVSPQQKEKLIEAFKVNGFTAMIGDGANDALAIKKADLGIAMFDGSSATRQIADIVLINNSFSALPKGVKLSDSIITTIEMVACLFFNKVTYGLTIFAIISLLGFSYPLLPRNLTVINYLTIGFPIILWAGWPRTRKRTISDKSFFKRVLPFAISNGFVTAVGAVIIFILSFEYLSPNDLLQANMSVVLTLIALGLIVILVAPKALNVEKNPAQTRTILGGFVIIFTILMILINNYKFANFFGFVSLNFLSLVFVLAVSLVFGFIQYQMAKRQIASKISDRLL
ncbi:MAG: HAD-IC family P-type ATPase [bacterium]|nr:HAD-IC family P-type ATPase [bacterium]